MPLYDPDLATLCAPMPVGKVAAMVRDAGFSPEAYTGAFGEIVRAAEPTEHFMLHGLGRLISWSEWRPDGLARLANAGFGTASYRAGLVGSIAAGWALRLAPSLDECFAEVLAALPELHRIGGRPLIMIGDSHTGPYNLPFCRREKWFFPLRFLCGAGSALGLANPTSRNGYGPRVKLLLPKALRASLPIVLKFGQVDIEFVYTFHRVRDGKTQYDPADCEAFCVRSADAYMDFLTEAVAAADRHRIMIATVFPPSLSDADWRRGYVNGHVVSLEADQSIEAIADGVRSIQIPDLVERTRVHAFYNARLEAAARQAGFGFVDDFSPLLSCFGVLDNHFSIGDDHHVYIGTAAPVLGTLIWQLLQAGG